MTKDINELKEIAKSLGDDVLNFSKVVLDNYDFAIWSGSSGSKHHYGVGGLARHTLEVVKLCFASVETLKIQDVDKVELFFACIFHDVGKLKDYKPTTDFVDAAEWVETAHKRNIHHITGSVLVWTHAVKGTKFEKYHDKVVHAILSHHGLKEWKSPVAPNSKVAWLLHLNDSISARIDDCQRIDRFG